MDLRGTFRDEGEEIKKKEIRKKIKGGKKGFSFNDRLHRYTIDGVELLSTTTLIDRYKKKFENVYISQMVSKKNNRNNRKYLTDDIAVRKYWSTGGKRAASLGTSGHAFCEMCWLDPEDTYPLHVIEDNALKAMKAIQNKYDILNMEESRGNKKYMMGYSIDLEMRDKKTGEIVLGDFKFAKMMTSEHYKEVKGRNPNYLLTPFRELKLRDIPKDKGEIQLNIYRKFYELDTGLKVAYGLLIHVDGTLGKNWYNDKGYKAYKVRDMQDIITKLLSPHAVAEKVDASKEIIEML